MLMMLAKFEFDTWFHLKKKTTKQTKNKELSNKQTKIQGIIKKKKKKKKKDFP